MSLVIGRDLKILDKLKEKGEENAKQFFTSQ